MVESHSPLAIHSAVHNYPDQFEMCGLPLYEQRFLNPTIPTKIFPLSRNPERFYRPIPIPVIFLNYITSQHDVQINSVGGKPFKTFSRRRCHFQIYPDYIMDSVGLYWQKSYLTYITYGLTSNIKMKIYSNNNSVWIINRFYSLTERLSPRIGSRIYDIMVIL